MYQIFIVDDDLTVQRELKILLENHGYRATLAKNFTNIPEEIEEQRPDLVLLDISLPSEDGIMLCSKIRMLSDVPIIFVHHKIHQRQSWNVCLAEAMILSRNRIVRRCFWRIYRQFSEEVAKRKMIMYSASEIWSWI